ncbi:MAG: WbqC family protein [Leadbetterella sp.]
MIFSSNLLPCQAYFSAILQENTLEIYANEQYRKQTYATRALILGPHQIETISVPIQKAPNNTAIKEIKIDYSYDWIIQIERMLQACYGKSPYYEYLGFMFIDTFNKKNVFLLDLHIYLLEICLRILKIQSKPINKDFENEKAQKEKLVLSPKKREEYPTFYNPKPYQQNFGNMFVPNLSIVDLLFQKGPDAILHLKKCFNTKTL